MTFGRLWNIQPNMTGVKDKRYYILLGLTHTYTVTHMEGRREKDIFRKTEQLNGMCSELSFRPKDVFVRCIFNWGFSI